MPYRCRQPGNTGPGNTGPGNTGPENTGPENTGPEHAGPENAGPENAGPENAGQYENSARSARKRPSPGVVVRFRITAGRSENRTREAVERVSRLAGSDKRADRRKCPSFVRFFAVKFYNITESQNYNA